MYNQHVLSNAEIISSNPRLVKYAMTEISTLETDALPHVKLNQDILVQMLKMPNLLAQRYVETVYCRVHNLKYVMMETILEGMAVLLHAKLKLVGNASEQKDR